jgi:bifunctional non-homologous end joining protein LigD
MLLPKEHQRNRSRSNRERADPGRGRDFTVHDGEFARSVDWAVQMGVLEIHPWGSTADDLDRPDRMFFDLDRDVGLGFEKVIEAARLLHARLADLGLLSFLKTTDGKGLHVVVPLERRHSWDELKSVSKALAEDVVRQAPRSYTLKMPKAQRKGKIFIDYLRNSKGQTVVAAFSTRAKPGATVSVPLDWKELKTSLRPINGTC